MKRRKLAWVVWGVFACLLAALILSRPLLEGLLRRVLVAELSRRLDAQVSLAGLKTTFFPPGIELRGLEIDRTEGPLRHIGARYVSVRPGYGTVFFGRFSLREVLIVDPSLRFELTETEKPAPRKKRAFRIPFLEDLVRVRIDEINVENAGLSIRLPGSDAQVQVRSGNARFKGSAASERWTWSGGGVLKQGDRTLSLSRVEIAAQRFGESVRLSNFEIAGAGVGLRISGAAYPTADLNISVTGNLSRMEEALRELNVLKRPVRMQGKIDGAGRLAGKWGALKLTGGLTAGDVVVGPRKLGTVRASIRASQDAVDRLDVKWTSGESSVDLVAGPIRRGKEIPFEVRSEKLSLRRILEAAEPSVAEKLAATVNLTASGRIRPAPFGLSGVYKVTTPQFDILLPPASRPYLPLQFRSVEAEGKLLAGPSEGFLLKDGKVTAEGVEGTYEFGFRASGATGSWKTQVARVSGAFRPDYPVKGWGPVEGGLKASKGDYEVRLDINLTALGFAEYAPLPFRGLIVFRPGGVGLNAFRFGTALRGADLEASIPYEKEELNLAASWRRLDLGLFSAVASRKYPTLGGLAGSSGGKIELHGPPGALQGTLSLIAHPLQWNGIAFDEANTLIDVERGNFIFQKCEVRSGGSSLVARGVMGRDGFAAFETEFRNFPLAAFKPPAWTAKLFSHAGGKIRLDGAYGDPGVDGGFEFLSESEEHVFRKEASLSLGGRASDSEWKASYGDGALTGAGRADLREFSRFRGEGAFQGLSLRPFIPNVESSLAGAWSAERSGRGAKDLTGVVDLTSVVMSRKDWTVALAFPARITLERGVFHAPSLILKGPSTDVTLRGTLSAGGDLAVNAAGTVSLQVLPSLLPVLARSEGEARVDFQVSGTTREPLFKGSLDVGNGFLQFGGFPHPVENIALSGSLDQRRIYVDRASARMADGELDFKGEMTLGSTPDTTSLALTGGMTRLKLRYPAWLPSDVSGNFSLTGPISRPLLRGDFLVHEATYRDEWDWKSKVLSFRRGAPLQRIARKEEEHVRFDVLLRSEGDRLFVKNDIASGRMTGQIRLTGSDRAFGILGRIDVVQAKVDFLDNLFDVTTGNVTFENENTVKAQFDVTGRTRVKITDIILDIRTQDDKVMAFLSSQPPLDETNILALLTLGVDADELMSAGVSSSALPTSLIPSVLSAPIQSQLETELKRARIVDQIQFVPYFSETTKTSGLKLQVGKQLFPKTKLSYSTDLFDVGSENTVKLEQAFNDHITLQGSVQDQKQTQGTQETNAGIDLEFRFDF